MPGGIETRSWARCPISAVDWKAPRARETCRSMPDGAVVLLIFERDLVLAVHGPSSVLGCAGFVVMAWKSPMQIWCSFRPPTASFGGFGFFLDDLEFGDVGLGVAVVR